MVRRVGIRGFGYLVLIGMRVGMDEESARVVISSIDIPDLL